MAHIHELYDFTVSGFIVNHDKLLLVLHKKLGVWLQPGGHIELDEDPDTALFREIEEETGLKQPDLEIVDTSRIERAKNRGSRTKVMPLPFDFNVHQYDDTHKHIDLGYLFRALTDEVRLETAGALDIGWFSLPEIEKLYKANKLYSDTFELSKIALKYAA